jgi:MFS transporter, SP family, sugar:H+ symporter
MVAVISDFFNQATGQAFANSYGVIFLKSLGTINAFQFSIISQAAGLVGVACFVIFVDRVGRRFFWFTQAPLAAACMFVIGGLGTMSNLTVPMKNGIAAMFPIFAFAYLGSFAPL